MKWVKKKHEKSLGMNQLPVKMFYEGLGRNWLVLNVTFQPTASFHKELPL